MPQDEQSTDLVKLTKLVNWLDEQRKQDKELIARLTQHVDRLSAENRETTSQLVTIQDGQRQGLAATGQLSVLETAMRQARDQLVALERHAQDLEQREIRNAAVSQVEMGRIAKALADVSQQIAELHRRDETAHNRTQLLSEELKHDRSLVAALPERIEYGEKQWSVVANRLQLAEEQLKRQDGVVSRLGQGDEEIRAEMKRLWQWQQSAELRWARQLAEWEQHMEEWQRLLDEHARLLQDLTKESLQGKELSETLRQDVAAHHDQLEERHNEQRRLQSQQDVMREEATRLMQGLDAQRRRIDEQAGNVRQLEEGLRQQTSECASLSRRLDNERARVDDMMLALQEREQAQSDDRGDLTQLRKDVSKHQFDLQEGLERLTHALGQARQFNRDQADELLALQERQRRRQIEELEQEICELRDRSDGVDDPKVTSRTK